MLGQGRSPNWTDHSGMSRVVSERHLNARTHEYREKRCIQILTECFSGVAHTILSKGSFTGLISSGFLPGPIFYVFLLFSVTKDQRVLLYKINCRFLYLLILCLLGKTIIVVMGSLSQEGIHQQSRIFCFVNIVSGINCDWPYYTNIKL